MILIFYQIGLFRLGLLKIVSLPLFVCLFGLWAGFRSLTDSPRVLIPPIERPRWGLLALKAGPRGPHLGLSVGG